VKVDLHFVAISKLSAEASGRRCEPQVFQLRRMHAVRQGLDITSKINDLLGRLLNFLLGFRRGAGQNLIYGVQIYSQQRKPLIDIVMKLSGNPGTFSIFRLK